MKHIILVFGLGCLFLLGSCTHIWYSDWSAFYFTAMEGVISDKKEDMRSGRPMQHFIITASNDSIYELDWIGNEDYYDSVDIGNRMIKGKNTMLCKKG